MRCTNAPPGSAAGSPSSSRARSSSPRRSAASRKARASLRVAELVGVELARELAPAGVHVDARARQQHLQRDLRLRDAPLLDQRQRELAHHAVRRPVGLEAGERERLAQERRPLAQALLLDQHHAQTRAREVGRRDEPAERAAEHQHVRALRGHEFCDPPLIAGPCRRDPRAHHRSVRLDGVAISVVIPTLNEQTQIERALACTRLPGVERIVVDANSSDGTSQTARFLRAEKVIQALPGRAHQMDAGYREASGSVVLFLHADTRLEPGWSEAVLAALEDPGVAGGAFRLRFEAAGPAATG